MKATAACSASLLLLLSFSLGLSEAIRPLKEGPMIDAEGREYKSSGGGSRNLSGPRAEPRSPVRIHCTDTSMILLVRGHLFQNGRLVSPGELFLGDVEHSGSPRCQALPVSDTEYMIEAGLQECGSELTISEDSVIYSNKLIISPAVRYHGIIRLPHAEVPVSCHYQRTHIVSSHPQQTITPSPAPPAERSFFSLKLMSDDWTRESSSRSFYLGHVLHLEASYTGPDVRRLFVDSCVVTLTPDAASVPRHYIIENNGCLTDAKQQDSKAQFRPRTRGDALQLQLDAFLFHQDPRNSIFVTCRLKASAQTWRNRNVNKACNFRHSRWESVDGRDDVCRCCDTKCTPDVSGWTDRQLGTPEDPVTCASLTLGPLMIYFKK